MSFTLSLQRCDRRACLRRRASRSDGSRAARHILPANCNLGSVSTCVHQSWQPHWPRHCSLCYPARPAAAITGTHWVEDFEHPYVGLIVFYDASGEFLWRCSGSLISPTKFLTAGHCTDSTLDGEPGLGANTARVYFQQDAGANFDPETEVDPVSGYPETCAAGHVRRHLHDREHTGTAPQLRLRRLCWLSQHARCGPRDSR